MEYAPRVSVVVPCFNEAPHVMRSALDSVKRQTFVDFECIVIDESTKPELASACRACCDEDPRFIYVKPAARLGLARSLNLGLERARGEFVARFDSDDICMPDRLQLQVDYLSLHSEVGLVGGAIEVISEDEVATGVRCYPLAPLKIARGMQLTTTVAHPTVMFRRSIALLHGNYNADFRFSEDLDLWLRWLNAGVAFSNLPQVMVRYRQAVTRRGRGHWKFNLRARVRNFSWQHAPHRLIGIVCIATWSVLPAFLQETVFRALLLRRSQTGAIQ